MLEGKYFSPRKKSERKRLLDRRMSEKETFWREKRSELERERIFFREREREKIIIKKKR